MNDTFVISVNTTDILIVGGDGYNDSKKSAYLFDSKTNQCSRLPVSSPFAFFSSYASN